MSSINHDAIIIGGGPAGSAAAITLARLHKPVCLLERKSGPHDKVCGEFISWEATQYLQDLGVDLQALGAQAIHRFNLYNGERMLSTELPFTGWSLSRRRLDEALLLQAQAAGAEVWTGVAVRKLLRTEHMWNLHIAQKNTEDLSNSNSKIAEPSTRTCYEKKHAITNNILRTKTVFLASGKHDLHNWSRTKGPHKRAEFIGLKMHLMLDPAQQEILRETVEIHLFDGGYAGLEPVEENKINLCFLINKNIFQACENRWPVVFDWLSHRSSHLRQRLAGSVPLWQQPLAVSGVPYGYIHLPSSAEPGIFRLGDQAAVIPSFAGDGIAMALHSAVLAARTYATGRDSATYHRQAQLDFQKPVRNAQRLAKLFTYRAGRKAALMLGRACPQLIITAVACTRINPSTSQPQQIGH